MKFYLYKKGGINSFIHAGGGGGQIVLSWELEVLRGVPTVRPKLSMGCVLIDK